MLMITILKVAIKNLLGNKFRSVLTMLGVIIGVGAVIAMMAIGDGAREKITSNIKAMGSNLLFVRSGSAQNRGVRGGDRENLDLSDLSSMLEITGVTKVSPEASGRYQVKYFSQNSNSQVMGVAPPYLSMRNYEVSEGRSFTDADCEQGNKVAVLGPEIAKTLFVNEYPVGKIFKIKGLSYEVIGVTKAKGDSGFNNPDEMIFVPFTAFSKFLSGKESFSTICIAVNSEEEMTAVKEALTKAIRKNHRLRADADDDFNIRDMTELLQNVEETSMIFQLLLSGVAALSLLVGGIGIMNIMFVTVTERTREIGIRKSLGARNRDILNQFLIEAVIVTVIGGLLGILTGAGGILIYNAVSPETYFKGMVSVTAITMSVFFAVSVGVFFGFYPALKASKLNPIDALRYE